ncbi:MAG: glycosyltransferase [Planctomycetota bacterium]|nr:glycosyltransferase [Planctomycetota bacterium]
MNTFVAGNVTFLHAIVGRQCVVGKSMMMRRETLELLGGFESYKDVLAEDYLIGRDLSRQGRKVALSNHVVDNVNTHFSMSQFINRQVRWSKLRYRLAGPAYGFEFLSNPVLLATLMLPASATNHLFAVLWAATCMLKVCADIHKGYIMGSRMRYYRYLLSPVKDLMAGWFNVVPFFDRSVTWRGNRMRIGRDTRLDPEGSQSPDR